MSPDRQDLCLLAADEVATRLDLHEWLKSQDECTSVLNIQDGNIARIRQLVSVLHDGLGGQMVTTEQIRIIVERAEA